MEYQAYQYTDPQSTPTSLCILHTKYQNAGYSDDRNRIDYYKYSHPVYFIVYGSEVPDIPMKTCC